MEKAALPPARTLVVHVWAETSAREGFRARITETRLGSREHTMLTTADPPEVSQAVERWVDRFLNDVTGDR